MRVRGLLLSTALAAAALFPAFGTAAPFDEAPVSDAALADQRGGFALPGGGQINVAVQSDTRINGQLVLRTVLIAAQAAPTLSVFVKNDGAGDPASTVVTAGGTTVNLTTKAPPITADAPPGMTQVALTPGQSVTTAAGDVRYDKTGAAAQIVLNAPDLQVRQLMGQAFGSIVSNRGNDMTIDNSTIINIDMSGAPTLSFGSALPRLDALAADAARLGH